MTNARPNAPIENVVAGFFLALLVLPVGVVILVLLSAAGIFSGIVGFAVAFGALFLYRRGSGGIISRVGAWIVVAIVVGTLLLGIWASLVVGYAGGIGHLDNLGIPEFWNDFASRFPTLLSEHALFVILVLAFGALGTFRTLGRAFATARVTANSRATSGGVGMPTQSTTTIYQNDVDGAPTGSADDKTAPPTSVL